MDRTCSLDMSDGWIWPVTNTDMHYYPAFDGSRFSAKLSEGGGVIVTLMGPLIHMSSIPIYANYMRRTCRTGCSLCFAYNLIGTIINTKDFWSIVLFLLNFIAFWKNSQRGYLCDMPMTPPVHISLIPVCRHIYRTCRLHIEYSKNWSVTNKGMDYCAAFAEFCNVQINGQRGYPSGTHMVPPVHNPSIPVCRHMNRTCSLHMTYSLIWLVTNKGMHCSNAFGEIYKNC